MASPRLLGRVRVIASDSRQKGIHCDHFPLPDHARFAARPVARFPRANSGDRRLDRVVLRESRRPDHLDRRLEAVEGRRLQEHSRSRGHHRRLRDARPGGHLLRHVARCPFRGVDRLLTWRRPRRHGAMAGRGAAAAGAMFRVGEGARHRA
ncbi:hypothetical protein RSA3_05165 [Microbacterium testaceum]|uniref:Uncharacterized protein n=1 Tax=Microbacterium testaceum TaxID=2033 RepID=A0A147F9S8_MICTE|nr:hypothetical protein RSA3_05165 [Microbacterium testaceum]